VLQQGDLVVTMTDLSKQSDTLGYPALVQNRKAGPVSSTINAWARSSSSRKLRADRRFLSTSCARRVST
jgi:hypothetical protein